MQPTFKYSGERKSFQSFNQVYFWTSVIKDWKYLLKTDVMKLIVKQSFQWLVQHELVYIYGYVIMHNHPDNYREEQLKMNGKESPKESFEKYTGHMFLKQLRIDKKDLAEYSTEQKDYMHYNPLQPHWQICDDPIEYRFPSAKFYEKHEDEFKIITHYMDKL